VSGWECQRWSTPLYPRDSVTGSQGEKDEGGPAEEDFGEAMHPTKVFTGVLIHDNLPLRVVHACYALPLADKSVRFLA
jgi:hypothetical protein